MSDSINKLVKAAVSAVRAFQQKLTPSSDWVEKPRERLLRSVHGIAQAIGPYHSSIPGYAITEIDYDEHLGYIEQDTDTVEEQLYDIGYRRNLLSAGKYRIQNGDKQWANSSWSIESDRTKKLKSGMQHHVMIFNRSDDDQESEDSAKTDLYAHTEPVTSRPAQHLDGNGQNGDPHDILDSLDIKQS